MSEEKRFDPEQMEMVEFKLLKGQIDAPDDFEQSAIQGHESSTSLELGFNLEEGLVRVDVLTEIKTDSNKANSHEATGNFHLAYVYKVRNLEEWAQDNGAGIVCDPILANALSASSYSTSRGILLTRLQGTALSQFILPVVNPKRLLEGDKQ